MVMCSLEQAPLWNVNRLEFIGALTGVPADSQICGVLTNQPSAIYHQPSAINHQGAQGKRATFPRRSLPGREKALDGHEHLQGGGDGGLREDRPAAAVRTVQLVQRPMAVRRCTAKLLAADGHATALTAEGMGGRLCCKGTALVQGQACSLCL